VSARALADLQHAFRRHVLGQDAEALLAASVGDRIPAAARLRVYRHHVITSLVAALGATFATVRAVVGGDFFASMARAFVVQSPPAGPVLSEYGAGFPAFVQDWPAAAGLAYLADVARLDWALNVAYNTPDSPGLTADHLAAVPPERLAHLRPGLRPGVSLLASPYPIDRIWALNHGDDGDTVDLDSGGVRLLVFPRDDDAAFAALEDGAAALLTALQGGQSLGAAIEQSLAAHPGLDVGAALGRLLTLQALAAIEPAA
jgi:hypothetical protein